MKEETENAAQYLGVIKGIWPLVVLGGLVAIISAVRQIKAGYRQRTFAQRVATVLLNATMTTAMAVSCAMLVSFLIPDATPKMQIAVCVAAAGLGSETIKVWLHKKLGLHVVDLMDPNDINDIRCRMTHEQRLIHVSQCPFKHDECARHCYICKAIKEDSHGAEAYRN